LLELIKTKINYVVQEAIVVIKDIFRKYPNKYESIIATLCENLETLNEPEAKASMIWIIGEYADRIDNADELIETFLEGFHDESTGVQLQLLTATVKLFLKRPQGTEEMVQRVINMATQETDNPDLRDRGYIYWRLLSSDPEAAKKVVLGEKPLIEDTSSDLEPNLLDNLIHNISSLASVYHKPPASFVTRLKDVKREKGEKKKSVQQQDDVNENIFDEDDVGSSPHEERNNTQERAPQKDNLLDDLFGTSTPTQSKQEIPKELVLPPEKANGLKVMAAFSNNNGNRAIDFTFTNNSTAVLTDFALQFNKNSFSFAPSVMGNVVVLPGQTVNASCPIGVNPSLGSGTNSRVIQIAMKNNTGIFYFQLNCPIEILFGPTEIQKDQYISTWKSIPQEQFFDIRSTDAKAIQKKIEGAGFKFVANRSANGSNFNYYSGYMNLENVTLLETCQSSTGTKGCLKSKGANFNTLLIEELTKLLS